MKFYSISLFLLFFIVNNCLSQGRFLMVGGGSEGSWSDPAYQWAAENKKVAIISFYDESNDLPNYFLGLGAEQVENIKINSREQADSEALYDQLMAFDVFFFKGGDQSNYYTTYQGTRVTKAMKDKYLQGGTLGGTSAGLAILGGVVYTAEGRSIYPDDALLDINNSNFTLKNDFTDLLPGIITDTHFAERGRHFRLMGFLARWYKDNGELLTGIGVDDKTAFCIDEANLGTVIGTGSVSVFIPKYFEFFDSQFTSDSLFSFQLIEGDQYQLTTGEVIRLATVPTTPLPSEASPNVTLLISGGLTSAESGNMLAHFIQIESKNDSITLITENRSKALTIIQQVKNAGKTINVIEINSDYNSIDSAQLRNNLRKSSKVLFYNNTDALFEFLEAGPTGNLIATHIFRAGLVIGFLGEDAKYAGEYYCKNNYTEELASYQNKLSYTKGLGLLKSSIVMPKTINRQSTNLYENNMTAIHFGIAAYHLTYGWYLNEGSYLLVRPENQSNLIATQVGHFPSVTLINSSKEGSFAQGRNLAAMDGNHYEFLLDGSEITIGNVIHESTDPYDFEEEPTILTVPSFLKNPIIYPNPSLDELRIQGVKEGKFTLYDIQGIGIKSGFFNDFIPVSELKPGAFILELITDNETMILKFIKD